MKIIKLHANCTSYMLQERHEDNPSNIIHLHHVVFNSTPERTMYALSTQVLINTFSLYCN